jgi:TonB family protein
MCGSLLLAAVPAQAANLVPLAMSLNDARVAVSHAHLVIIEQLDEEQHTGDVPSRPWDPSFTIARRETASAAWANRFTHRILSAGHYSVFGRCPGFDSLGHAMPARFRVTLVGRYDSMWIRFRSGMPCAQFGSERRPGGSLELGDQSDSLFAMLREAVGADTFVASAADSAAGSRAAGYAAAGGAGSSHAHGDSVYVEVLPEALERVPPEYPTQARVDGVAGTVIVIALISAEGRVADAFVHDSIPELDRAAMEAVRQWKFKPASTAGKPLAVWVAIPVKFTLR